MRLPNGTGGVVTGWTAMAPRRLLPSEPAADLRR